MQPCVLFGRQLFAREDYNRQIGKLGRVAQLLQHIESRHVGQAEVEHRAVELVLAEHLESLCATRCQAYIDVIVAQQLADAELFRRIIFDHQEALARGGGEILDLCKCRFEPSVVVGLVTKENAPRERP